MRLTEVETEILEGRQGDTMRKALRMAD